KLSILRDRLPREALHSSAIDPLREALHSSRSTAASSSPFFRGRPAARGSPFSAIDLPRVALHSSDGARSCGACGGAGERRTRLEPSRSTAQGGGCAGPCEASSTRMPAQRPAASPRTSGRRSSLIWRLAVAVCALVAASVVVDFLLEDWLGDPAVAGAITTATLAPVAIWVVRRVLVPVAAMFRAL